MAFEFALLVVVSIACGAIGHRIAAGRTGLLASLAVGLVGAFVGTIVARAAPLAEPFSLRIDEIAFPLVWAVVGSASFVAVTGLLHRRLA